VDGYFSKGKFVSLAMFIKACFTNQLTIPGLAPQQETAVLLNGFFLHAYLRLCLKA